MLAEGPGLLLACVAPLLTSPPEAIWLAPTEAFKRAVQPTRGGLAQLTSDPARAYEQVIRLDLQLTAEIRWRASASGLSVLEVDMTRPVSEIATLVAHHFAPLLSHARLADL